MTPIDKLLNRIKWDQEFGRGRFEIGYYDRISGVIIRVAPTAVLFVGGKQKAFCILNEEGVMQTIPLHRIREVYRDDALIWARPAAQADHLPA